MKLRSFLLLLLCAAAWAAEPMVIAHRGGKALRPENTLAAFRHALRLGVPMLEFDMVVTADNEVVIHHDLRVNREICRVAEGKSAPFALIRELTLAQVRAFDCGLGPRPEFPRWQPAPGAGIPTLREVLRAFHSSPAEFLAETKMDRDGSPGFTEPDRFVELVLAEVRRLGMERRFILQSGDLRTLAAMQRRAPEVRRCLINTRRLQGRYLEAAREAGADAIMIHADFATPGEIRQLRDAGIRVYSSTANDRAAWERYRELRFDGILTDDPEGLLVFLGGRGPDKKIRSAP